MECLNCTILNEKVIKIEWKYYYWKIRIIGLYGTIMLVLFFQDIKSISNYVRNIIFKIKRILKIFK